MHIMFDNNLSFLGSPLSFSFCALHRLHPAGTGRGDLCRLFLMVHESCREQGATPSQYLAFLNVYIALYSRKQQQLTTRQQHLQVKYNLYYITVVNFISTNALSCFCE